MKPMDQESIANLQSLLQTARAFIFDMDGTVFVGNRLLPGARELLDELNRRRIPFFFLTNNSSKSVSDYVEKLKGFGLNFDADRIITSGVATAAYLKKNKPGAKLYVVGTPSLETEFEQHGFVLDDASPDFAVLGYDTTLTYAKLCRICDLIRAGVPYIATHPDINCPTETGFIPDIGSFMALIEASTGRQPDQIIGKPHPPIVDAIVARTGLPREGHVMVGDRLYTDIALGKAGIKTILVFSGEAKPDDLVRSSIQPDASVEDLAKIYDVLLGI